MNGSDLFFRIKDNGAAVFRVEKNNQQARLDLNEIAFVNTRNGKVRPHGNAVLSEADLALIADWLEQRLALEARREADEIHRLIDQLNLSAHWAQSRASDAELEAITDDVILAMHDFRTILVRKKAERLRAAAMAKAGDAAAD